MRIIKAVKSVMGISFIFLASYAYGQTGRGAYNLTEIGALIDAGSTNLNAFRLRTGFSKMLNEHMSAGFALGTDNYKTTNTFGRIYNLIPLTVSTAFFLSPDLTRFHIDLYGGYAPKFFRNLDKGFTAGAGLGYGFPVTPNFILNIQTGYNFQQVVGSSFPQTNLADLRIHAIRAGIGLLFR